MSKTSYGVRFGHARTRIALHPRRKARQERAYARGAARPGTKPNPEGSKAKRRANSSTIKE